MSSLNKVLLIGNLGQDPNLRFTPSGSPVCELSIATNEKWTDKAGRKQERVEWHTVVIWGNRAEAAAKYLCKGRQVYVEGRLRTRSWEDSQHEGRKCYRTEVICTDIQYLGGNGQRSQVEATQEPKADEPVFQGNDVDEDILF